MLEEESGLLGLCGGGDLRDVLERIDRGDADAQLAFAVWRHRCVTLLGGCVAALGGIDVLAFTGGIGEHLPAARAAIADGLGWLGVRIDERWGEDGEDREITAPGARVRTFVITAREDLQLAAEAGAVLGGA
jgi:acetate kinase